MVPAEQEPNTVVTVLQKGLRDRRPRAASGARDRRRAEITRGRCAAFRPLSRSSAAHEKIGAAKKSYRPHRVQGLEIETCALILRTGMNFGRSAR